MFASVVEIVACSVPSSVLKLVAFVDSGFLGLALITSSLVASFVVAVVVASVLITEPTYPSYSGHWTSFYSILLK